MKRFLLVFLFMVTAHTALAQESDRLGVFAGASHLVTRGEANRYDVSPNGATAGVLIPVHLSHMPLFVKLKVLYHGAAYTAGSNQSWDSYIQASNSFLAGVKAWRGRRYAAQVLLGPGIQNESVYPEWGTGASSAELFGEVSVLFARQFGNRRVGALVSYEHGLSGKDSHLVTGRRVQASLVAVF